MNIFYYALTTLVLIVFMTGCFTEYADENEAAADEIAISSMKEVEILKVLMELHRLPDKPYRVATGDKFDFYVYDNADLNSKGLIVMPDGSISIGLIGVVKVSGLTVDECNKLIEKKLLKYINNPKPTLIPTEIKSSSFTIIGKVGNPGVYTIRKNAKLTDAIALAQGFSVGERQGDTVEMADLEHAFIARDNKILPVDFVKAIRKGDHLHNIPLQDGDYIYIPSTMNREIFVMGEVLLPGYVAYNEGMTIVQALSYARKRLDTASDDALVIRGNLNKPKVYLIDVEGILYGERKDFRLRPNDIVFFPKDGFSEYNEIVEKLLPTFELLNLMAGPFGNAVVQPTSKGGSQSSGESQSK